MRRPEIPTSTPQAPPTRGGRVARSWSLGALALCFLLCGPTAALAVGLCLESTDACNDYFLVLSPVTDDIFSVNGYEYGCGVDRDQVAGTMRLDQRTAYFGLTGSAGGSFDSGPLYHRNYVMDTVSQSGTYKYFYAYLKNSLLRGRGGNGSAILFVCSDPGLAAEGTPDEAIGGR